MLRTLRIRQFVIIDDLTVDFGPGLTLLTGETGAGKSILVDAVGLAMGQRAARSMIRAGADKAIVEAQFDLPAESGALRWAAERGLDDVDEDGQVVIRRELPVQGNGRVLLNGSPITLSLVRELAARLLELHGQHDQQSLLSPERHLELVDRFGGHRAELAAVIEAHREVVVAATRRDELQMLSTARRDRAQELERAVREIEAVAPRVGELADLDAERRVLQNGARMTELLDRVVSTTYDGEPAAAALAAAAARDAAELAALEPALADPAQGIETAAVELQDAGAAFRDYRDRADFDPQRLEEVEARRAALRELFLRYGEDEEAVLEQLERVRGEWVSLRGIDEELEQAGERLRQAEEGYVAAAARLTRARQAAGKRLAAAVEAELGELALGKARLEIAFAPARGPRLEFADAPLGPRGVERAEFRLAANPGEPFRELAKVASGGELSRVMLAVHSVFGNAGQGRVLVFDEVDSGVGGAVADAVGARLARLADGHQVLCVTHLPQVAAYADRHYAVRKAQSSRRTVAEILDLGRPERVEELARMLGGREPTAASRRHASELLRAADRRPAPGRSA